MVGLGDTLRGIRKNKGLTRKDLSKRSGVHWNSIRRAEESPEHVGVGLLLRICAGLEIEEWRIFRHVRKAQGLVPNKDND